MRSIPFVLLASALLACSSSGGSAGGDGGTGGSSSSGGGGSSSGGGSTSSSGGGSAGVSLAVDGVTSPVSVGGLKPSGNTFFLVVDLTLANTGTNTALSANPVLFSLQTAQSLDVSSSADVASKACSPSVSVASGGHVDCEVVFEVPDGQTPAALLYDDLRGDTASAPISATVFDGGTGGGECTVVSGWLASAKLNTPCFDCLVGSLGGGDAASSACVAAGKAYETQCGNTCSTCSTYGSVLIPTSNTCTCEPGCESYPCQQLFQAAMTCEQSACASSCP